MSANKILHERASPRLVVGVGAAPGEHGAMERLLSLLAPDSGMAFVLMTPPTVVEDDAWRERLALAAGMPVTEAAPGVEIRPNTVYLMRDEAALGIRRKTRDRRQEFRASKGRPFDRLLRDLARAYGVRAAGVALAGIERDGSAGLSAIRRAGGLAVAQAIPGGEPQAALQQALVAGVDLVIALHEIPAALARFVKLPPAARETTSIAAERERLAQPAGFDPQALQRLAALLQGQLDFDLRVYKPATTERRLLRRLTLSGFQDLDAYVDQLALSRAEQQALVRDLFISVTDFFRDPEAFEALRELVVNPLVAQATPGASLRAWVPACATGEEAYSIAMEFMDAMDAQGKRLGLQIFATDIDHDALRFGRAAIYPASIAERMSPIRLQTYFSSREDGGYQVRKRLRDVVSFAEHDLTKDPPFSRMALVSCRNLLIYLTPAVQKQVLKLLHLALEPRGNLLLGSSESASVQRGLFETLSKGQRIYRKCGVSSPLSVPRSRAPAVPERQRPALSTRSVVPGPSPRRPAGRDLARRAVLDAWAPPTVLVSEDGLVLFMHGELSPYLRFPQGENPRLELAALLRPEIATRTRGVLYKCRKDRQVVVALSSPSPKQAARVRITARPAPVLGDEAVMLSFEPITHQEVEAGERPDNPAQEALIDELEKELQATREDLRNAVEELEVSSEELRASNEESMSMNEELQSANEELEATTEELRSLNEELTTVNGQLRDKVEQLEQAHDDLHNFFASAKLATIFLDERMRIKRFTPAARDLLQIDEADLGRSAHDIARELFQHSLDAEARAVLEHFSTSSRELRTREGRWIARHVLPYRTESRRIEGVVVNFADITELKLNAERLALRERQQSVVARIGLHALREANLQTFMEKTVREVAQTLDVDYCKILELQPGQQKLLLRVGVGWKPGLVGSTWVGSGTDSQAGYTLQSSEPVIVADLATEKRFSGPALLTEHEVISGLSCVIRHGDAPYGVLGAHARSRRDFKQEDTNFLQAVAAVVGSAITRHQTRLRLALELSVAHVLSEASDMDEAFSQLLPRMAAELRAAVAEVWWPDEDTATLRRRQLYVAAAEDVQRVHTHFARPAFAPGEGAVGHVFAEGQTVWCTDLGGPWGFVPREGAKALGLVSGFVLPVRAANKTLGVITLYSSDRMLGDDFFLRSLEVIGRSIGEFVVRAEIEQRVRRLAAITESTHDAILTYDCSGRIREWLPGAERLLGYTAKEMIGHSVERIVPEELRDELWTINARIRAGEVVEPFETRRVRRDGQWIDVSVRSSPIRGRGGEVVGISSTDRDITRQKETERTLVQADRQKDEFLAMLGHELRNPLAAIRGATELLKRFRGTDPQLDQTHAVLDRQARHMAKLLDGLLDVSRIIRGQIKLEPEVVDFRDVCREATADLVARLNGRRLDIQTSLPADPVQVEADPVRLRQILDNLLSNAVKYTPDGGAITLTLGEQRGMAVLQVRDTGVGIAPDLLPHVFGVFRQSQQDLGRAEGGLGLGLALVKSLVELHAGSVEARSRGRGEGAELVVHLPATNKRAVRPSATQGAASAQLRVLLIEDNEDAAEMLRQVLESAGHEIAVAGRGREGIALAKELRPDAILCDIGLPDGVSGFDVARALRAFEPTRTTPLVALSGYGGPNDKAQGSEAGFDAYFTKPVDIPALKQLLAQLCAARSLASEGSAG